MVVAEGFAILDDRRAGWKKNSSAHYVDQGNDFYREYRFLAKNGEYRQLLDKALIIRDSEGRAVRSIGALRRCR